MAEGGTNPAPKYPAELHKLELSTEEFKDLLQSKLKAICYQKTNIPPKVESAIDCLTKQLTLRTNKGDGKLDRRRSSSNAHHHTTGTIPDELTSPKTAASKYPTYVPDQKKAYREAQYKLIINLIKHRKINGEGLKVESSGQLKRDGKALPHVDLCNIVDDATRTYMQEAADSTAESHMTTAIAEKQEISDLLRTCVEVTTGRIAVSQTFNDNILDEKAWRKWAKHVEMLASLGALAVVLQIRLG